MHYKPRSGICESVLREVISATTPADLYGTSVLRPSRAREMGLDIKQRASLNYTLLPLPTHLALAPSILN
jgi:hypothetical protein